MRTPKSTTFEAIFIVIFFHIKKYTDLENLRVHFPYNIKGRAVYLSSERGSYNQHKLQTEYRREEVV